MAEITRRIRIEGLVQGVGCRLFIEREAVRLGLRGYVRNRRDGSVEVLASGDDELIAALVKHIRKGPRAGRVDFVHIDDDDETSGDRFVIASTV